MSSYSCVINTWSSANKSVYIVNNNNNNNNNNNKNNNNNNKQPIKQLCGKINWQQLHICGTDIDIEELCF